jgi:hypothetical protein
MNAARVLAIVSMIGGAILRLVGLANNGTDDVLRGITGAVLLTGGLVGFAIARTHRPDPVDEALWRLELERAVETRRPKSHSDLTGPTEQRNNGTTEQRNNGTTE